MSLDAFLHEFRLSDHEGLVLMCLAEALLRVPDPQTADRLIRDKIGDADWMAHFGHSDSIFVNASTLALVLTGRVVTVDEQARGNLAAFLGHLVARTGEPIIRTALVQAMRILSEQFIMGRTIEGALARAERKEFRSFGFSYDMLGEAALSATDANTYFEAYMAAIRALAEAVETDDVITNPGISVKLSALHPRYEYAQRDRVMAELVPRLAELAENAAQAGIGLCVDAEEADRLDISLDVIKAVSGDPKLAYWQGFGLAVQAYQKRAPFVIDWLADLARRHGRRFMIRLTKGAYWDSEIKRAQEMGLDGYPVFTRKPSSDVSFLACARKIIDLPEAFFPQFATHNAQTISSLMEMLGDRRDFEFQRLHGMGEVLYDIVSGPDGMGHPCRIYAPVGSHEDLLAYLVRRLLENGSNTSFVNRIGDANVPVEGIVADPAERVRGYDGEPHPKIPMPLDLFGSRRNSRGINLDDPGALRDLADELSEIDTNWRCDPIVGGKPVPGSPELVRFEPGDDRRECGRATFGGPVQLDQALECATQASREWDRVPASDRAAALEKAADLMEERCSQFIALCMTEAGKTLPDAIAEIREAVDFCRFYAMRARAEFSEAEILPGPTGEINELSLHGRGVFACISPWNFPLAIFLGQITAALAAGNAVIAKPAEQTPLIAARAVALLHEAGIPPDVLHLIPGDGPSVGAPLVSDPRVSGVAFTGSGKVARDINQALARRPGPIIPLIAETGGQNAMIVDSTALAEQVVADTVVSAFRSAGQRCSALRVLFLQEDVADRILEMLAGAVSELRIGDPRHLATDVGPVIDRAAMRALEAHVTRMKAEGKRICSATLGDDCSHGNFIAPQAFLIDSLDALKNEVFGPILHVITYGRDRVDQVINSVNEIGYGLTLGIHSRINGTAHHIHERLRVGNTYVNRNMIGAVVGSQPFGGEGLSGTGPKAGGPRYLHRFATERTLSIDTSAAGGNAALLSLNDGDEGS